MIKHTRGVSLPLVIAMTAAVGVLVGGWQGTGSARPATASPITAASVTADMAPTGPGSADPGQADSASARPRHGGPGPTGVCSKDASGRVVNCPKPIARNLLPPQARNAARLLGPVSSPATFLDTRTWTTGGGNTFPGADWPFGMIQWSPDTSPHRSDGGGYTFGDTRLVGYALTHLSGPGCVSGGDIPILPMTGRLPGGSPSSVTTAFTNRGEVAQAGYYSARSNGRNTITSQFSATAHSAIGRFTFPRTRSADFLIKLRDSERGDSASSVTIVSDKPGSVEIQGSATSGNFCNEYPTNGFGPQKYTVHFDIFFSQPFTRSHKITLPGRKDPNSLFLTFNTTKNRLIDAKVAISYVSAANARQNWFTEDPGWNFAKVKANAQSQWNTQLSKISVSGGSQARTQEFYSLLYKALLEPNIVSDVNGQYLGAGVNGTAYPVETLSSGQQNQYGMFSGWDLYHGEAQLIAMLDPMVAGDMAQSLVNEYAQNGILPQWGFLNTDNYTMVGDPADAIIADFYAFGARNFDTATALTDMLAQANNNNTIRPGATIEARDGYLPQTRTTSPDSTYGCCRLHDQVSALLEYDNADFALSQYAAALGDSADATALQNRANNWANELDANSASPVGFLLTPRCANNPSTQFVSVTPTTERFVYVEGDAYEYLWDVPNNYAGLFADLGVPKAKIVSALTAYLSVPNSQGLHAFMSNEFDLGEQVALDYAGHPAGTQLAVNTIRTTVYQPGPSGLRNNDDLGAMSSQFIWEMLGMYPENPGNDNLVFASPGFPHEVITLPDKNTITITATGASASEFYVRGLSINGTPVISLNTTLSALDAPNSTMTWTMSKTPTTWGQSLSAPPSYGTAPTPPASSRPISSCP
jgi:predicted alpha-1,2-mannosidase